MWWFSAAFTAFLVVTVVGLGIWFLPHMFTPPPREPDFEDVDELVKVSRQSILPEKGVDVGPSLPEQTWGFPGQVPSFLACAIPGNPHRTDGRDEMSDAYQASIQDRLHIIRERAIDVVALAAQKGDSRTVRAMDDLFLILNALEAE